jgi:hypothetical protein
MEFDGVAPSGILAATHVDFSAASLPANAWPSGAGQAGFYYGRYIGADSTSGSFDTAQMSVAADPRGGATWNGGDGELTPALGPYFQHPGREPLLSPSVRRYLVGASGETAYTGSARVVGRFFDFNGGATSVFVAVDSDGDAGPAARDLTYVPATALAGPQQSVTFDFTTDVAPGTTIDFGVLANGSFNSDDTGLVARIVTGDTAVPTHVVANTYNSTQFFYTHPSQDYRGHAFVQATDGKATAADVDCFDTYPGLDKPYQFAGLLYRENVGSGKATRFDSVQLDIGTAFVDGGDFAEAPRLFLLRHNSDPGSSNPASDDRYALLPVTAVAGTNAAGRPTYTFDLSALSASERTGYGFAVVGPGSGSSGFISVSEISATAVRVADSGVIAPQPFFVQWTNNHRYALTTIRGDWDQAEAEAVSLGGHLVSLNSTEENDFITSTFGFTEEFFIGLRQNLSSPSFSEPAGGFEWVNGDPVTFTNWHGPAFGGSEPNHAFGAGEDYAIMGYFQTATGTWGDVKKAGFPETSNYRGIIELPTAGAGEQNFSIPVISAKSNIFDAGLASPTQGGVLPPSLTVTGLAGQFVTFPKIVGVMNTAADVSGPDGAHTAGRSCDLTGVGGISGYLNGNNTPALVGVFLGAAQPAQQPERLDFSASALGENFMLLAPALGQVFFIGDGFTSAGQAQEFIIPAGAERLYFGIPDGNNGTLYHGTPAGWGDNSGSVSLRANITASPTPVILTADFPDAGGAFSAAGGSGAAYTWAIFAGALPPHLQLNADGTIVLTSEPRMNGTFTFTVQATDASGSGQQQFTIVVADPVDVPPGIVAWWPGDNGVNEIIGGRHGTFRNVAFDTPALQNGSAYRAGTVGRGLAFDGVNDCIEVADHDSLDITGDLTIEAWVKATATSGERTIVSKRDGSNANVTYVLFARDGELRFASRTGGGAFSDIGSGANLPAGFSHVAATISGTALKFFINGEDVGSSSIPARPATSGPLTIGGTVTDTFPASSPDGPWSGVIDELSLYNRALTTGEISTLYAAGAGGKKRADAAREFSPTQNPAGVWSYLELPSSASLASYDKEGAVLEHFNK